MLLNEIFAKDIDLGNFEKKVLVNTLQAGDDGLNITTLYPLEPNKQNLKRAKDELLDYGFIEETDQHDFYIVTDSGRDALERASLIDQSGQLNDVHARKYLYTDNGVDSIDNVDSIGGGSRLSLDGEDDSLF